MWFPRVPVTAHCELVFVWGLPQPPPQPFVAPFQQGRDFAGRFSFQQEGPSDTYQSKKAGGLVVTPTTLGKDDFSREGDL